MITVVPTDIPVTTPDGDTAAAVPVLVHAPVSRLGSLKKAELPTQTWSGPLMVPGSGRG